VLQQTVVYVIVQIAGCCLSALLAHAMFEMPLIQASLHLRTGPAQWLSEGVATAGLILVVMGSSGPNEAAVSAQTHPKCSSDWWSVICHAGRRT
jgi:glycerol uptake facilitator-like aquaporin